MKGIQFVVDEHGDKKAVLIDLKKNKALWEDFFDRALSEQRAHEPREPLDEVRKKLFG